MTTEQLQEIVQRIEVITENVASDPMTEDRAYNRCAEKLLSRLQEARMWANQTLIAGEQSENSNQ